MIKHVGKHNDKKVIIVFREVPNEEHMCLVVYSDLLSRLIHDELMSAVEGVVAQSTPDLADVLFRTTMADGRNLLTALHAEQFMKKVPTNQVLVTPTSKSSVRLDELNSILKEMAQGEQAVKRLEDLDKNAGMVTKRAKESREVGAPVNTRAGAVDVPASTDGVLTDADLAKQLLDQSVSMKAQAEQLLAEAKRLEQEAKTLKPTNVKRTTKKTTKKQAA